jgi:hypothetical protein
MSRKCKIFSCILNGGQKKFGTFIYLIQHLVSADGFLDVQPPSSKLKKGDYVIKLAHLQTKRKNCSTKIFKFPVLE